MKLTEPTAEDFRTSAVNDSKKLKHRMPTKAEWRSILNAIGPTGVQPAEYLADWISDQLNANARMQDCVQKYRLGLGGEKVSDLLIAEVTRQREAANEN